MDPKEKKVKEEELNVEETHNPAEDQPQNEQAEGTAPLTHEEELEKELEKAQEALEEQKDKYLRLSAEFDNYRKRTLKEKAELILNGGEKSLGSILPVVDDFERAIKTMETATDVNAVKEGVELIYNKFMAVLAWEGWRRQDLVRFGKFTRAYSSRPQLPDEASGYTTVFPIPEKIRVMNERLKQNPGY
jgi:molecular chaperone GrpE